MLFRAFHPTGVLPSVQYRGGGLRVVFACCVRETLNKCLCRKIASLRSARFFAYLFERPSSLRLACLALYSFRVFLRASFIVL